MFMNKSNLTAYTLLMRIYDFFLQIKILMLSEAIKQYFLVLQNNTFQYYFLSLLTFFWSLFGPTPSISL